jgi:hypothetical protein
MTSLITGAGSGIGRAIAIRLAGRGDETIVLHGWGLGFVMPMVCFLFVAFYGFTWAKWYACDADGLTTEPASQMAEVL